MRSVCDPVNGMTSYQRKKGKALPCRKRVLKVRMKKVRRVDGEEKDKVNGRGKCTKDGRFNN